MTEKMQVRVSCSIIIECDVDITRESYGSGFVRTFHEVDQTNAVRVLESMMIEDPTSMAEHFVSNGEMTVLDF